MWRTPETTLLLLLLLLLMSGSQAQSGDGHRDTESRLSCTSHITKEGNSLTCDLLRRPCIDDDDDGDDEDDEDDEEDVIERMTLCSSDWTKTVRMIQCVEERGNTLRFSEMPVVDFNLTVQLKRGGTITTIIDLKKIIKPRSPQVWNVTFNQGLNQAVVHIHSPYHSDYLKADNQLFQLHIWTSGSHMLQNISSETNMKIDMEHLRRNTKYHVAVRAIPVKVLEGSWSEWSDTFTFFTPSGEREEGQVLYKLMVCLILVALIVVSIIFFWKNKIFTYMWPSIPHPEDTLVQICKPNKGLLLNFKPEVFNDLRVSPIVQPCEGPELPVHPANTDRPPLNHPCSTQSSDCRSTTSVSTEELELSALLSRSSSDPEDSLQSTSPSSTHSLPLVDRAEGSSSSSSSREGQQEEAYVTMSSFYQVHR